MKSLFLASSLAILVAMATDQVTALAAFGRQPGCDHCDGFFKNIVCCSNFEKCCDGTPSADEKNDADVSYANRLDDDSDEAVNDFVITLLSGFEKLRLERMPLV